MNGKKILIIDDDADLLQLVSLIFTKAGANAITACDGAEGLVKLLVERPNLIVLDVMMPGADGFDVCQRIRKISNIPLILLTALEDEEFLLNGFGLGADDYLTKPFNSEILLARVKALLRRSAYDSIYSDAASYDDGRLRIDSDRRHFLIRGKRMKSSPIEFRLLLYLERHAGKVLTYDQILSNVWGAEYRGNPDLVYVYISHLRSKIERNPKKPRYILSVPGVGYLFERQNHTLAA